jgi:hypothetical protein
MFVQAQKSIKFFDLRSSFISFASLHVYVSESNSHPAERQKMYILFGLFSMAFCICLFHAEFFGFEIWKFA